MKKILLSLVVLCMTCLSAMAGSDIKVTQGDKKFFKSAEGGATLEISWKDAKYDNGRETLEAHFGDMLTSIKEAAIAGFMQDFAKYSKKVNIVESSNDAKYKIVIKLTNVDQYYKVMGFVPGNATKIWGTLSISDTKSGEVLLEVSIDELDGGASPSPIETVSDSFEELAKQICKLK